MMDSNIYDKLDKDILIKYVLFLQINLMNYDNMTRKKDELNQ